MNTENNTLQKKSFIKELDQKLLDKEFFLQILNRDQLKYIALILMTFGHWALKLRNIIRPRALVRFAISAEFFAPFVFFFFISEGYYYTRDRKKYALRLLICALITQIPHTLTIPDYTLKTFFLQWSVIMTLFLGLLALMVLHSSWKLPVRLAAIAGLMGVSWLIKAEWFVSGIIVIICLDLLRNKPLLRFAVLEVLTYAVMCTQVQGFPDSTIFIRYFLPPMIAGVVITFFYNGKKGHFPVFSKYFFYIWYPLHLLLELFF